MAVYGPFITSALAGYLSGASVKALLTTSAYVQDVDQQFRSSVTNEVVGTGYTAGGVAVTGVAVMYDSATNHPHLTCDPVDFGVITIAEVAAIVFYVDTGSPATDVLIATDPFGPTEVDNTTFQYIPHADGLVVATIGA